MIAMATDFLGEQQHTDEIENLLKKIADSGFSHVHWCHEWEGNYMYAESEMDQIAYWLNKYNLKVKGVHGSEGAMRPQKHGRYQYRNEADNRKDYTSENEWNRKAGVDLIKNRVLLASKIGGKEVVLHMQLPWKAMKESKLFKATYFAQVYKSFDELELFCKEFGVRLALENLLGTPLVHQKEQFDKLFSRYNHNFLGFCFDPGHGAIMSQGDPLELIKRYQHRLIAMHLNDNMGATPDHLSNDLTTAKQDFHMIPGQGMINWDELAGVIAKSSYELPLTLELSCKGKLDEFLKKSLEKGLALQQQVILHRQDI